MVILFIVFRMLVIFIVCSVKRIYYVLYIDLYFYGLCKEKTSFRKDIIMLMVYKIDF